MAEEREVTGAPTNRAPQTGSKLAAALVASQADLKPPPFDSQSTAFGGKPYRYASLQSVIGVVRPALAKHGLAVMQELSNDGNDLLVTTRLVHSSGESMESVQRSPCPVKPQDRGGVITYLRRYGLNALLCLAAEEDDDAEATQTAAVESEKTHAAAGRKAPLVRATGSTAPPPARFDNLDDEGTDTFTAVEATKTKEGVGKFGPWELVVLKTAEGPTFSTLNKKMAEQMRDVAGDGCRVRVTWSRSAKGGLECKEIVRLAETGDA